MAVKDLLNKGLLLHGIGAGVLKSVSGKIAEMTTSQSMNMDITATTEDVYGGDGLFPLYTYISKKEGTVEITNAEFKLSQVQIAQGTKITTTGNKRNYRVLITKDDKQLIKDGALTGVETIAVIGPDGNDASANVTITDAGAVTFGEAAVAGEYAVWFKATDANSVKAEMLKNAMPEVATFNWMFTTEDSEGNKYQIDIYARRVRADGELKIETARDKATTPSLKIKILDPGDGHDDFAVVTITPLAA